MTEEEKFNNWYGENFGKWTEGEELLCPSKDFKEYAEEVYLAGLHEGQPKWHKVADGGLPKKEGEYLCYYTNVDHDEGYLFYGVIGYYEGKFCLDIDGESWNDIVIAWCEIPQFNSEEQK